MLKQRKYIRGHYRTIKTDRPVWDWQYQLKLVAIVVCMFILMWQLNIARKNVIRIIAQAVVVHASFPLVSPIPVPDLEQVLKPSPTPQPTILAVDNPTKEQVIEEIKMVFGQDAPKAFKLLSCENPRIDPGIAANADINHPRGSRDIGVFQINEYWQAVNPKFLFNPHINIQIAKQLYDENDHSFRLWTCGKELSI